MSLVVRNSETHGMGVYTNSAIKLGECVTLFHAKRLFRWGPGIEPEIDLKFPEGHYLQVGPTTYMEPVVADEGCGCGENCPCEAGTSILDLVWYVNHSCEPNLRSHFISEDEVKLIAMRDIEPHEELTWDYSTTMLDPEWKIKCLCQKPSCRKIIAEFASLPKEIRDKYREAGGLPWYLKGV